MAFFVDQNSTTVGFYSLIRAKRESIPSKTTCGSEIVIIPFSTDTTAKLFKYYTFFLENVLISFYFIIFVHSFPTSIHRSFLAFSRTTYNFCADTSQTKLKHRALKTTE